MHALAGLADALGQQILERGLAVFVFEQHLPLAARMLCGDLGQAATDRFEVGG